MTLFDSRIVRRTVCESMPSRVQKLLQWVVALENQHALREDTAAKGNACALDFGDPKENTNMPNGTNDVASLLLGILAYDKMSYKSFLKSQVGIISLGTFQVEPTRGAYDPMDSRLLRSTSNMSELSQR